MKKVKISKVPSMAWGGRIFNQVAPNALPYQTDEDMMHYNDTLQPVDRDMANLEAEKGEEVLMPNYKGMSAKFKVGGKRHYDGGTPLNLPDDSFVFSDTRAMKIKDPNILKMFGKAPKKGGYTPAELAKPYDINKYRKVLDDPMADPIQKKTAEEMIGNYNILLGKLALAQESKKGFPQGIPFIAEPYMMMNNINPEDVLPMDPSSGGMGQGQQPPMAKYGGAKKVRIKQLPRAQFGDEVESGWDEITGQAILSANPNEGQMVDISTPNDFSTNWDSGKNNDLTFNSMVDKGFYEKPIEMDLKSERQGIDVEAKVKEKDKRKLSGVETFAAIEIGKNKFTDFLNNRNQDDPMLAYRTMEDTMSGVPTSKGTFDPLNKNNLPYKNDYATYDPFTYSAKYGISLPKAQPGLQMVSNIPGMAPANPMVHPFNDPLTQNIATYRDPKTLPPANNLMIQNALDQQATAAAVAASLQDQIDQSAKSSQAASKTKGTTSTTSTKKGQGDLMDFNQEFWDEYSGLGKQGVIEYDIPQINFTEEDRVRASTQSPWGDNIYGDLLIKGEDYFNKDLMSDFKRRHSWYLEKNPDFNPHSKEDVSDFQKEYCKRAAGYGMKKCYFAEEGDPSGKPGTYFDGKFGEHTWSAPGFNKPKAKSVSKKDEKAVEELKDNNVQQAPPYNPFEYYPQDVLNLMTAMGAKIPDPQTFYSNLAWQGYSPAYIKEDYSPIMESANIATQGIGAYGSRQSADASYSGIQGKAARQAADHNLQVANLNVGIYNDAEKFNAQTREKNYMYNQVQKQQNFDTEQAYMADRIKAKNEKRANVAALYNQMLTNAVDTYNLNIMNHNFKVLPGTGGRIEFVNPDMLKPNKNAMKSARMREYESLIADGYTHDQAIDIIGRQTGKAAYPQQQQYPYSNPYDYTTGLNYYEQ